MTDGGAAFPTLDGGSLSCSNHNDQRAMTFRAQGGMSLRDYFAAHAPTEVQIWFKPVMPAPRPEAKFVEQKGHETCTNQAELDAYDRERNKQRLIQWPYAWADTQLEQRALR